MFCAQPISVKVCTSVSTTMTAAASSCGTYQMLNLVVVQQNTTCTATQIQLTTANEFGLGTASPFTLTIAEGSLIAAAILGSWALGWSMKQLKNALNAGSPE
jgi:hypothetical protein